MYVCIYSNMCSPNVANSVCRVRIKLRQYNVKVHRYTHSKHLCIYIQVNSLANDLVMDIPAYTSKKLYNILLL